MNIKRVNELIKKYTSGTATDAEEQELNNWYRETAHQDAEFPQNENEAGQAIFKNLSKVRQPNRTSKYFGKWMAAASIFGLLSIGIAIYILNQKTNDSLNDVVKNINSAETGRAVLILANGEKIDLNDASSGNLVTQGNIKVTKVKNGQLIYTFINPADNLGSNLSAKQEIAYNTIKTPVGVQYEIVLPDKSKVWLNSMSSLKFPVSFDRLKERRVELSGEGYFQVAHHDKIPFKVITGRLTTIDLGTQFNIKAYAEDADIRTTLVEGSASVTDGDAYSLLKPGEQAAYRSGIKVTKINVDEVIAWKNGYFSFDGNNLEDIMKSISRWYNIQCVFQDESLKKETYGFVAARSNELSNLLKLMEQTGTASFTKHGTTITISKKKN